MTRRTEMAERIADSLLSCGVAQIPLRDLAARLGTSDRMLLYYFEDKADLIRVSLGIVSTRLSALIADPAVDGPIEPAALADHAYRLLMSEAMTPYMAVWGDLAARATRGEEPFRAIAGGIIAGWLSWLESRLAVEDQAARSRIAAAILSLLEGARMLEAIRPGSADGVIGSLAHGFDRKERSVTISEAD